MKAIIMPRRRRELNVAFEEIFLPVRGAAIHFFGCVFKFVKNREGGMYLKHFGKSVEAERENGEAEPPLQLVEPRAVEHDRLVRLVSARRDDDEVALKRRARGDDALARHQSGDDYLRAEVLVLDCDDFQPRARARVQTTDQIFEDGREERARQDSPVQSAGVARRRLLKAAE